MKNFALVFSLLVFLITGLSAQAAKNSDWTHLKNARTFFGNAQLDKAIEHYNKVPASSDYWLEATEEKAHALGRKGDFAGVIAQLQTLFASTFDGVVGPEPYFVASLTYLKICDYTSVLKTNKQFKERFQSRIENLEKIKKNQNPSLISELVKKADLSFAQIGSIAKFLPRLFNRDQKIAQLWPTRHQPTTQKALSSRLSQLSAMELKEIEDVINKLQIAEAEVIHRVHLADKKNKNRPVQGSYGRKGEVLIFPYSKEVWIDELDSYAAQVEKCPSLNQRASL